MPGDRVDSGLRMSSLGLVTQAGDNSLDSDGGYIAVGVPKLI